MSDTEMEESGGGVVVDALPYIDSEFDEQGMKEMVTHLITQEKSSYRPTLNYLSHLPPLDLTSFTTPLSSSTFAALSARQTPEVLSMKRYELPPPPPGKLTDVTAWGECVDNSYAQLEHQAVRVQNLELQLEFGAEGWRSYLGVLEGMVAKAQGELAGVKKQIQGVNWTRKSSQTETGENLNRLESSWVGLVSKNYEIERACLELEKTISEMEIELARKSAMDEN